MLKKLNEQNPEDPIPEPPKLIGNVGVVGKALKVKRYCDGCVIAEIPLNKDLCVDCLILLRDLRKTKKGERFTKRKCQKCGKKLTPARYFQCRQCLKPNEDYQLASEWYQLSNDNGRKHQKKRHG